MKFALLILPLLLIIILLILRKHMLIAAFLGGALAIIIGRLDLITINDLFMDGISRMLAMTVPVMYAATASMVTQAGSIEAVVNLANHYFKGRIVALAGIMVFIQGVATLMSGLASANSIVIAPLMFAAFGAIPEVIAGMTIVSAVAFSSTPVSGHANITAELANVDILDYFSMMQPIIALFFVVGVGIAVYGVLKRGSMFKTQEKDVQDSEDIKIEQSVGQMWRTAIPFLALLIMAVFGANINKIIGINLFLPSMNVIFTVFLTIICTKFNPSEAIDAMVSGSKLLLVTLFSVGLFLGFINFMGEIGTFVEIANLVKGVPQILIAPVAILIGYFLAIPVGALSTAVAALVLPSLAEVGMPPLALGLVAVAIGFGTQVSPVQINIGILSNSFKKDIMDIIKHNLPYSVACLITLIVISLVFV